MIFKSDITLLLNYMHFNIDWLLYFSIGCFGLALFGACMNFIEWLNKPSEHESKPSQGSIYEQVKNFIAPAKYELTVSHIQFCREVIKWALPILKREGIKNQPKVIMRYGKGTRTMGTYSASQNLVTIHLNSHDRKSKKNLYETLCSTVLHEIFHAIQAKTDPQYKALTNYKKYGYWDNRIEVEARAFESKWYLQCIEDLVAKGIIIKVY